MEEIKIRELPEKSSVESTNYLIAEDNDGTKKVLVNEFRTLLLSSLFFDSVEDLKNSTSASLKEGDICETLGYYTPGDGGAAKYRITYNPGAVEDGKLVHYLSYSDTLRAELVLGDTINVHQFGAMGDGATDDTDAIQAAIDNSSTRIIEFGKGKTYVTRTSITINKSHVIINGNGATLYPHYVNGIDIKSSDTTVSITDITINKLNFDCSRANTAIYAHNVNNMDIVNLNISQVSNKGIHLEKSSYVNIINCKFDGTLAGFIAQLSGSIINITGCRFANFNRAIYVSAESSDSSINLNNCDFESSVDNNSCVYVASPIKMITINSVTAIAKTFLYFGGASSGRISCRDISCTTIDEVFNIGAEESVLYLDGTLDVPANAVVFENMTGKLHSNIMWNSLLKGANFNITPIGELFDAVSPYTYKDTVGFSVLNSRLTLHEVRNMHVDWSSSTSNLNEIVNGVKGQLLYVKSSTNKNIIAVPNKIVLSAASIQLGQYKGVLLKHDGLKWIQVQ